MTRLVVDVPVLYTDRLILREPREADFEPSAAFFGSDRSAYVGGPADPFQVWRGFLGSIGHWVLRGYGLWVVEERDTGHVAGRVGFVFHDGWDEPELGWTLFDGFEGRGIAFEATKIARTMGRIKFGLDGVVSYIDPENTRSLALARRLGAVHERDGTLLNTPCQIWRHPKSEAA